MKPRTYITIKGKKTLLTKKLAWELCLKHWNNYKRRRYNDKEYCLPYRIDNIPNNCFFCAFAGQRNGDVNRTKCKKYCLGLMADKYKGSLLWCEQYEENDWRWDAEEFHANLKRLAKKEELSEMKTLLLLMTYSIGLALSLNSSSPQASPSLKDEILEAIIQVESGGNNKAIGDSGRAVGILQIWPIMVKDCNRIIGKDAYSLKDRYSREKSIEMYYIFIKHYCKGYTDEQKAACWNSGPKGKEKLKTNKNVQNYVKKVLAILNK